MVVYVNYKKRLYFVGDHGSSARFFIIFKISTFHVSQAYIEKISDTIIMVVVAEFWIL